MTDPTARADEYAHLLDCYLSDRISERQWHDHLKDEAFAAWLGERMTGIPAHCRSDDTGVRLPLVHAPQHLGTILDASGRDILTVDVNAALADDEVARIADWIVRTVNASAGLPEEPSDE